jgi:hypothetical protein
VSWKPAALAALIAAASAGPAPAQVTIFTDGFEGGNPLAWNPPTVLRFADLDLRDPHVFVVLPVFGCSDVTDVTPLGDGVNPMIEEAITTDGEPDGLLDLSLLLQFRPFDPAGVGQRVDFRSGSCTAPLASTTCAHDGVSNPAILWYDAIEADLGVNLCLEPAAGTTSGYSPPIEAPSAPCFATQPGDVTVSILGLEVPLRETRIAAAFAGGPPQTLASGLLSGFVAEADADALIFPPSVPIVGGQPLSSVLPGGAGNCAAGDDRDVLDAVTGWWFYLNYPADEVPYQGY